MKTVKFLQARPGLAWSYSLIVEVTEEELAGLSSHHQQAALAQINRLH